MSEAPRHGSNWFNQNYDKLILFVALVALFGSALFLVLEIGREQQELTEGRWEQPGVALKQVEPADLKDFDAARAVFTEPFQATTRSNQMMVSELRVRCVECDKPIPFDAVKCPHCQAEQPTVRDLDRDGDGLPDRVEEAYGLNPLDPDDAAADLDGDGFTNLEEYQSDTKLDDKQDAPSPVAKLRVARMLSNPFKLRFQGEAGMPDGTIRYQLNLRTLDRTYFVKVGDDVEGVLIEDYEDEAPEGQVLILKKDDKTIRLVKGQAVEKFELVADMIYLIDRTPYRVRIGDVLKLKDQEYKVIDIRREGVLIRDVSTGKNIPVGMLSESEKSALTGGFDIRSPTGGALPGAGRSRR